MKTKDEGCPGQEITFSVSADSVPLFFQLLQRGFVLRTEVGCSVRSFLCNQLRLSLEFVENRITTIFLNGKPVDDIDAARVKDGSTLALSSAMPGLVGATMRRGGYYASLRSQISYGMEKGDARVDEGLVTLKLFNIVAWELGPAFLEKGVCVAKEGLDDFLKSRKTDLSGKDVKAELGGKPLNVDTLPGMDRSDDLVLVRLKIRNKE